MVLPSFFLTTFLTTLTTFLTTKKGKNMKLYETLENAKSP